MINERIAVCVRPLDNLAVLDLARTAFAAQLPRDLDLVIPRHDMCFGKQAAVGVYRQFAAYLDTAALRERGRLAGLAESETLERNPREDRECVVGEKRVHVLVSNACHLVNRLQASLVIEDRLLRDAESRIGPDKLLMTAGQPLHPANIHGALLEVARPLGGRDHHADRTLVNPARVDQVDRRTDVAGY